MTRVADRLRTAAARGVAGLIFVLFLAMFTWKLLQPQPLPPAMAGELQSLWPGLVFCLAKSAHLLGYTLLMFSGGILISSRRGRAALMILLFLHAAGTEIGQTFIPQRTGSIRDVVIDLLGIALGRGILAFVDSARENAGYERSGGSCGG